MCRFRLKGRQEKKNKGEARGGVSMETGKKAMIAYPTICRYFKAA